MTRQRYRGGRHGKGERTALISRVAPPLGEAVRVQAEERGMSVNDYVASVLAREVGMTELAPQAALLPHYEELPISDVA
ncbi:toxin-antitoxin system HicB family antitoxin (plasmid) [Herbiconiux sp. SALV-R1]|nr:toxin-antitoxin system HicB family antitoxin [Herbiconiux sp. KACC 21604]QJU56278.1 toxin-antitoxin system HicB family antitoxin [Herbiconiux sp. SALV-R1]